MGSVPTEGMKSAVIVAFLGEVCYYIVCCEWRRDMKRQTRLFPKAVVALERLGENIKLARRRRGIKSALMAERADMSLMTLRAIERGSPKVAMGNYMSVLFCLGMQDDMAQVAAADLQGRDIQDARLLRGSRQGGTR